MASSCHDAREALLECLADSPCYLSGKPIKDCVQLTSAQSGCKELNSALFQCRRGQLDMRKRIKGNLYFDGEKGMDDKTAPAEPEPSR